MAVKLSHTFTKNCDDFCYLRLNSVLLKSLSAWLFNIMFRPGCFFRSGGVKRR